MHTHHSRDGKPKTSVETWCVVLSGDNFQVYGLRVRDRIILLH